MTVDEVMSQLPQGVFTLRDRVAQVMAIVERDLLSALDRELKIQKTLDNVRAKYGNDAVEDNE